MRDLRRDEQGASLIEFALILPILLLLVFGIIEASWAFAQHNDVRYGAREGARLAAVEDTWGVGQIGQQVCDRMDVVYPATSPEVTLSAASGSGDIGSLARITVESPYETMTGFLDGIFGGITLRSTVEFRVEQPYSGSSAWWGGGSYTCV